MIDEPLTSPKVTAEDYVAVKRGEKTPEQVEQEKIEEAAQKRADTLSIKAFVTGVTGETIPVYITDTHGGVKEIMIRARLSHRENRKFRALFDKWGRKLGNADVDFDEDETEKMQAEFNSLITLDADLDYDFWMGGDYDATLVSEIMMAYLTEAVHRRRAIEKFRHK